MKKNDGIQVLRALAATLVVIHHIGQIPAIALAAPGWFIACTERGGCGVDVFFVISGYVMSIITRRDQNLAPRDFLVQRWGRVLPLYWSCSLAVAAIIWIRPTLVGASASGPVAIGCSLLLFPFGQLPLMKVGWSLVFENYFYLVFAFLLFLPRRWLGFGVLAWLAIVSVFSALSPEAKMLSLGGVVGSPLVFEFAAGVFLGIHEQHLQSFRARSLLTATAVVCTGYALYALPPVFGPMDNNLQNWDRILAFGLPSTLLVAGVLSMSSISIKWPRIVVFLGDASYSVYLIHLFVLGVIRGFVGKRGALSATGAIGASLISIFIALSICSVCYVFVEAPLQSWIKRKLLRAGNGR